MRRRLAAKMIAIEACLDNYTIHDQAVIGAFSSKMMGDRFL
jgi:hypothetical protein